MDMSTQHTDTLRRFLGCSNIAIGGVSPEFPGMFNRALTHSSTKKPSYERLEFLGDRVLNLIVAEYLYNKREGDTEGEMTKKMEFTNNENLGILVQKLALFHDDDIQMGKGAEVTTNIYADVFEATIGALFLDRGLPVTRDFVSDLLGHEIDLYDPSHNFKGRLQEYCQQHGLRMPRYIELEKTGPDHLSTLRIRVEVDNLPSEQETGKSKIEAEQKAARKVLERIAEKEKKHQ
jgi:ribonuclease III